MDRTEAYLDDFGKDVADYIANVLGLKPKTNESFIKEGNTSEIIKKIINERKTPSGDNTALLANLLTALIKTIRTDDYTIQEIPCDAVISDYKVSEGGNLLFVLNKPATAKFNLRIGDFNAETIPDTDITVDMKFDHHVFDCFYVDVTTPGASGEKLRVFIGRTKKF